MSMKRTIFLVLFICFEAHAQSPTGKQPTLRNIPPNVWLFRFDKDGDRRISPEEAGPKLRADFEKHDSNKNGFLGMGELKRLQIAVMRGSVDQIVATLPESISVEMDVAYRDGETDAWRLDVVRPTEDSDTLKPAIIYLHGYQQDKLHGFPIAVEYAKKGYVCVNINYRMGEPVYQKAELAAEDVQSAVRWLRANAMKYNIDPKRIGGYGYSLGGNLVALLGVAGTDAKLMANGPHQDQSSQLQAVCTIAGAGNLSRSFPHIDLSPEEKEKLRRISAISYVSDEAPPFLIVKGTADRVEVADSFVEKLKSAGAQHVEYMRIDGAGHGLIRRHADKIGPAMEKFFEKYLREK